MDKDDVNKEMEYRDDAVDIVKAGDGYAIGYTQEGEWLEYTVNVAETGEYGVSASYATSSENAGFNLYVDGEMLLENVVFPQGADWSTYATHDAGKVSLPAGEHVLRLEIVGNYVNIDWLEFVSSPNSGDVEAIREVAKGARVLQGMFGAVDVFSVTGRYLGPLNVGGPGSLRNLSAILRQAGYAQGMYVVRGEGFSYRVRVH